MTKFSKFIAAAMAASALALSAGAAKAEFTQSDQLAQAQAAYEASARDYTDAAAGFQMAEDIAVGVEEAAQQFIESAIEAVVEE